MKPKKNESVKITLKQNILIAGLVVSWSSTKVVLKHKNDTIVIPDVSNILFYLIENKVEKVIQPRIEKIEIIDRSDLSIEERIDIDSKNLAELKVEEAKAEREMASEKLKDLTFSRVGGSNYGIPSIISKIKISK
jgi:hypothetical protein